MNKATWAKFLRDVSEFLPEFLQGKEAKTNLLTSLIFLIVLWVGRKAIVGLMGRRQWADDESRLLWHVRTRNLSIMLALFGLMTIWATELQTFALSAVAFAAALVVATKELIMCVSGGFMRMTSDGFSLGDRIEIGHHRGEVVNLGFLTTTLLEIGPGSQRSGRAIILPNSIFVTSPLINETFTDEYVLHMFQVPVKYDASWKEAETMLLDAAKEVCAPYLDAAHRHLNQMAHRHALVPSTVEPRIIIQMNDPEKLTLLVRFPTPAREKGRHEQEVLKRFLTRFGEYKQQHALGAAPPTVTLATSGDAAAGDEANPSPSPADAHKPA